MATFGNVPQKPCTLEESVFGLFVNEINKLENVLNLSRELVLSKGTDSAPTEYTIRDTVLSAYDSITTIKSFIPLLTVAKHN